MKKKIVNAAVAILLLLEAFTLGYVIGFAEPRQAKRVIVAKDTSDEVVVGKSTAKAVIGYDPYFTRKNLFQGKVN